MKKRKMPQHERDALAAAMYRSRHGKPTAESRALFSRLFDLYPDDYGEVGEDVRNRVLSEMNPLHKRRQP